MNRPTEARRIANQTFILAIILGLAATVFVYAVAPLLAPLQNIHGQAATTASECVRIDGAQHGPFHLCRLPPKAVCVFSVQTESRG
ncbi:MAG: hypothetical protein JXQ75_01900 [Phycisphaerae bacterium]|nr:hypothetical protein [Phycisphaerae bacterium]